MDEDVKKTAYGSEGAHIEALPRSTQGKLSDIFNKNEKEMAHLDIFYHSRL